MKADKTIISGGRQSLRKGAAFLTAVFLCLTQIGGEFTAKAAPADESLTAINETGSEAEISANEVNTSGDETSTDDHGNVYLNYLYLEETNISPGQTTKVLVSLSGLDDMQITDAELLISEKESGSKETLRLLKNDGPNLVFDTGSLEEGVYGFGLLTVLGKDDEKVMIDLSRTDGACDAAIGVGKTVIYDASAVKELSEVIEEESLSAEGDNADKDPAASEVINTEDTDGGIVTAYADTENAENTSAMVRDALTSMQSDIEDEDLSSENKKRVKKVVVLDPGHDDSHAGARANGLLEEKLTLTVANYCKNYLESNYSNVTVYMTRSSGACPYPGTSSTDDNAARVAAAASVGANAYVSIHFNTTGAASGSSNGAMVFYPNGNYLPDVSSAGRTLAVAVQTELVKLGLKNNGVKIYNSQSGDTYPDGSLADYYGVIRRSKLYGFPGIIIEHAFLNNASDAAFCSSEDNLRRLGEADALGIAAAMELSSGPAVEEDGKTVNDDDYLLTCKVNAKQNKVTFTLEGTTKADKSVHFHVYALEDGLDGVEAYEGKKESNAKWTGSLNVADHAVAGEYKVFAYTVDSSGSATKVATESFTIDGPSCESAEVTKEGVGKLYISAYDVYAPSGIAGVKFVVTNLSGTKKTETITAKKKSGTYQGVSDLSKHAGEGGNYNIDVVVTDKTDIEKTVYSFKYKVEKPEPKLTATLSADQSKLTIKLKNADLVSDLKGVRYKVKSVEGKKTKYYTAKKAAGGYKSNVAVADFGASGVYKITAYAKDSSGSYKKVGKVKKVTVEGISGGFLTYAADGEKGSVLQVSGINAPGEIESVSIKTWPKTNKEAYYVYEAEEDEGIYYATVNYKKHKKKTGTYKYEVTVKLENGVKKLLLKGIYVLGKDPELYTIAGPSSADLNQLVAYYEAHAAYPSFYGGSDATSLRKFCKLYLDECQAEGIRAEVAFCQAMKETNFLRYGGDVDISQYNFAGIGATGGGVKGNSYASVQIGIRAHIQHLKAYATTTPLVNTCVDDRFQYVKRNTAPYVEWLGIPDNPYGKGWATDTNYGASILTMISELLSY